MMSLRTEDLKVLVGFILTSTAAAKVFNFFTETKMWQVLEESSMLGIAHAGRSLGPERRQYKRGLFWATLTLILWAVTAYLLYRVIIDYLEYPVLTSVTVESPDNSEGVNFPTVLFCNQNPAKCKDLFKLSSKLPDLWEASGCRVGPQIEDHVKNVITQYNVRSGFPIKQRYLDKDASGSQPLIDFWAHSYMESMEILAMLMDKNEYIYVLILALSVYIFALVNFFFQNGREFTGPQELHGARIPQQ